MIPWYGKIVMGVAEWTCLQKMSSLGKDMWNTPYQMCFIYINKTKCVLRQMFRIMTNNNNERQFEFKSRVLTCKTLDFLTMVSATSENLPVDNSLQ